MRKVTNYDRAVQVWVLLSCAAHERTFYTYGGIARKLGIPQARQAIIAYLGPIMYYCQKHDLPPLTILVVNQETGQPGDGLSAVAHEDREKVRVQVFQHEWLKIPPPTAEEFKKAMP